MCWIISSNTSVSKVSFTEKSSTIYLNMNVYRGRETLPEDSSVGCNYFIHTTEILINNTTSVSGGKQKPIESLVYLFKRNVSEYFGLTVVLGRFMTPCPLR